MHSIAQLPGLAWQASKYHGLLGLFPNAFVRAHWLHRKYLIIAYDNELVQSTAMECTSITCRRAIEWGNFQWHRLYSERRPSGTRACALVMWTMGITLLPHVADAASCFVRHCRRDLSGKLGEEPHLFACHSNAISAI
jgi:hypothetical protein